MYLLLASTLVLLIVVAILYVAWAKRIAATILLIFTAEAIMVRNIHPSKITKFIVGKAIQHTKATPIIARPVVSWYIKTRGAGISAGYIRLIQLDIEEDRNIELVSS